ncbi:hypothetical protein BH09BAC2_BH09BAC2_07820 [soil metagenome]
MKWIFLIATTGFVLFSCKTKTTTIVAEGKADSAVAKQHVAAVLDSMHEAFKKHHLNTMTSFLGNEGYYLGTDPNELWTKKQLSDYLYDHQKDTTPMLYTINRRDILLDSPGFKSALAVEQYFLPMSKKVMVRSISRLKEVNGKWLINFYSWNLIPANADVDKINKAL